MTTKLRAGTHVITLTATNSLGLKATATTTVAVHAAGRKVAVADVYAVYRLFLGRDPVYRIETTGYLGTDFGAFVEEVRWSEEAILAAASGYVPASKSAFTGLPIKQ